MTLEKQKTTIIFAVQVLLMTTAFFGNLFVEGWNWSPFDFIIAAALLFGTVFFINLVIRSKKTLVSKLIVFCHFAGIGFSMDRTGCWDFRKPVCGKLD